MIIDITNSNLINIKAGDMIYSIGKDEVHTVVEIERIKGINQKNCLHIFTDVVGLSYIGGWLETIDTRTYNIFREITLDSKTLEFQQTLNKTILRFHNNKLKRN